MNRELIGMIAGAGQCLLVEKNLRDRVEMVVCKKAEKD
jgi:hypothetical protein